MAGNRDIRAEILIVGTDPTGLEIAFALASLGRSVIIAAGPGGPASSGLRDLLGRLRALGIRVIEGDGRFAAPDRFEIGALRIRARRIVLATGARPRRPPLSGIDLVPDWPDAVEPSAQSGAHLLVLGAAGTGVGVAQAARQAGARVTLLARATILPEFDPEAVDRVRVQLERDGISLRENVDFETGAIVRDEAGGFSIRFGENPGPIGFTHLICDCGAVPNISGLAPEQAGIALRDDHPVLDAGLRTTNRKIFAVGAVTGLSGQPGRRRAETAAVLGDILFRRRGRIDPARLIRQAGTQPDIAEFGLTELAIAPAARRRHRYLRVPLPPLSPLPRASMPAEPASPGALAGQIKVIAAADGEIRGASVVAADAGDLIVPLAAAISERKPIRRLADLATLPSGRTDAIAAIGRQALRDDLQAARVIRLMRLIRVFG